MKRADLLLSVLLAMAGTAPASSGLSWREGAMGGAAAGGIQGAYYGYMADYDVGQALYAGLRGAGIGAAIGGGTGAIMYGGLRGYSAVAAMRAAPRASLVEQPRDALDRFAPKVGGEVAPGSIAESATWDAIANKPGWTVTRGRIYVRDATGQVRVYDGYATSPSGRNIGIEVTSGTGRLTPEQRAFDTRLNSSRFNTATGTGQHDGVIINRTIEVRR